MYEPLALPCRHLSSTLAWISVVFHGPSSAQLQQPPNQTYLNTFTSSIKSSCTDQNNVELDKMKMIGNGALLKRPASEPKPCPWWAVHKNSARELTPQNQHKRINYYTDLRIFYINEIIWGGKMVIEVILHDINKVCSPLFRAEIKVWRYRPEREKTCSDRV